MSDDASFLPYPPPVGAGSPTTATPRSCGFPDCARSTAPPAFSSGRPPAYCDDPGHTATTAFRERQRRRALATDTPPVDDPRPIETATQRAAALRGQVAEVGEHLMAQLRTLLDELSTLSDPGAAAVQIEAVTSEASEQVAAATARAVRAEQAVREAQAEREQADTAAEEALARLEEVSAELERTHQGWQAQVEDLTAAHETLVQEHQQAMEQATTDAAARVAALHEEHQQALSLAAHERAELVQAHERAVEHAHQAAAAREEALIRRAEEQVAAEHLARQEADTARQAAEGEARAAQRLADRAEQDAAAVRAQLAELSEQDRQLRSDVAQLRTDLAVTRTERDAAVTDIAREREAADQRVREVRELLGEETARLRKEVESLRQAAQQRDQDASRASAPETQTARRGRKTAPPTSGTAGE